MTGPPTSSAISPVAQWFGALGGALAWLLHLIGAAIIAEWGCFAGLYRTTWYGLTPIAWMIVAVSLVTGIAAVAATITAFAVHRRVQRTGNSQMDRHDTTSFLGWFGVVTSALFVFIIVAESIPLLFFLSHC